MRSYSLTRISICQCHLTIKSGFHREYWLLCQQLYLSPKKQIFEDEALSGLALNLKSTDILLKASHSGMAISGANEILNE